MSNSTTNPPLATPALKKKCTQCPRLVEDEDRKMCAKCRENSRLASARRAQKAALRWKQPMTGGPGEPSAPQVALVKLGPEPGPSQPQPAKPVHSEKKTPRDPGHVVADCMEYQTARALKDSLRLKSRVAPSRRLQFDGCYSIVADPGIDLSKRAKIAMEDVGHACGQLFGPDMRVDSSAGQERYSCFCEGKKGKSVCGGQIQVLVVEDRAHPRLSGQKIFVKIRHPPQPANP